VGFADFIFGPILARLDRIEAKVDSLTQKEEARHMALQDELDALAAQVTENTNLENSAITLIQGLADQIANAADDPTEVAALSARLKSSAEALAAAITANTPQPPTP